MSVRLSMVAVAAAGMMLGPFAARSSRRGAPVMGERAVGAALEAPSPAAVAPRRPTTPPTGAPARVVAATREVRDVTVCSGAAWAATRGGLERYALGTFDRTAFGVVDGLDTLDVHAVRCEAGRVVAITATAACEARDAGRFHCAPADATPPSAPAAPRVETFRGEPITARAEAEGGAFVGTSAAGLFWVPTRGEARRLTPAASIVAPASFPKKVVAWRGRVWIGTFDDGLYVAPDVAHVASATKVAGAPFRMVNDLAVGGGALFVASNEGLFVARGADGRFGAVRRVEERGVSGVAPTPDGRGVYATSSAALFRVRPDRRGAVADASWWRPAGTRSLQGVAADADGAWLASEDRGAIRFDAASGTFAAHDRLAGLPSSWVLGVASDGRGGAFLATLRDGALHLRRDGAFERLGDLPSEWTLGVDYDAAADSLFVSTQDGAVRYDRGAASPSAAFALLPDARVHAIATLDGADVVATEAGLAVYSRSPTCQPGLLAKAAAQASEQNQ